MLPLPPPAAPGYRARRSRDWHPASPLWDPWHAQADVPPVEAAPVETAAVPPPPEPDVIVRAGSATVDEILELSGMRPQLPGIVRALGAEYLPPAGQPQPALHVLRKQLDSLHQRPLGFFPPLELEE